MVQKRQLAEEEYDVSPKHLKLEHGCQLFTFLEFPSKDVPLEPYTSGKAEGRFSKQISESDTGFESGKITSSWSSSTTSEEDARSEAPIVIPEQNPFKPRRTLIQPEDTYSYLLRCLPLKQVPVGPEYQGVIPEWCGYDAKNTSLNLPQTSELKSKYVEDEIKFIGSCVIPMPEEDQAICENDAVGKGRTDCYCENPGSISCVRQHIREARENLMEKIGQERFSELGFDNMGEVVAEKWTEADERLFHEVVYSNPASLGKNFWDHLAKVFPSRTNQEIISYYFNVFVLRRRAEQNRCYPMNIDSDDDEWQGNEEDEDSCRDEIHVYDSHGQHASGIENPVFDYCDDMGFLHGFKGSTIFSETQPQKLFNSSSFDSSQPSEKTVLDESGGDCDFQGDSCTSSDIGGEPRASDVKVNDCKSWGNHEFIFEPSDSKVWDVGYFSCPRNETDFLPTGSMIEEVFGVGSWNSKVTDNGKHSS